MKNDSAPNQAAQSVVSAIFINGLNLSFAIIGNWEPLILVIYWLVSSFLLITILEFDKRKENALSFSVINRAFSGIRSEVLKRFLWATFVSVLICLAAGVLIASGAVGTVLMKFFLSQPILTLAAALFSTIIAYYSVLDSQKTGISQLRTLKETAALTVLLTTILVMASIFVFTEPPLNQVKIPLSSTASFLILFFFCKTIVEVSPRPSWLVFDYNGEDD